MNSHFGKWIVVLMAVLFLTSAQIIAQAPPPESAKTGSPPVQEKKAEKEAPPKKKMKKVHTLFGDTWIEDTGEPEAPAAKPDAAGSTAPASQTNPIPEAAPRTLFTPAKEKSPAPPSQGKPEAQAVEPGKAKADPGAAGVKTPAQAEKKQEPATPPASGGTAPPAVSTPVAPSSAPVSGASLVFNNADLIQVIQVIANLLRLNYILDPGVRGVVTITTMGDISNADLMQILQTLLRINGATAIQTGNIWQIVPLKSVHQIPITLDHPGEKPLSPDDQMVTEIIPMQFVSAVDMTKILKDFLSDAGSIVSHDRGNILILTDASRNMARLLELIRTFDSDAFENRRVQLYTIKNNSARSIIEDLKNIFSAYAMSDGASAIRFIPIDRMNAILAVAPNPASFDSVEQWIDKLDQPSQSAGIRNYVYHLQYAKAGPIKSLLSELYGSVITGGGTPGLPRTGQPATGLQPSTAGLSTSTILAQASKTEQLQTQADVYGFQGSIKVVADDVNNMLIIQATPQDYGLIEQTLRQIDIMPRQVLIEAQIFSVDLLHDFSLGIEYTLQQRGTAPNVRPLAAFSGGTLTGSAVILKEGARELFAKVTATENRSRTKALSSPSILATDNQEARIQVGVSIPTLSSSGFARTGSDAIVNTIQNVDTGVILTVTPHVSASGLVGMKINQEVSSPVPPPAGVPNISPSINRSSASTSFVVKDGETVAIAGIITENKALTRNRIPLLGDIPILGAAFGNTSTTNKRSELIIFITPHVIDTLDQQKVVTDALRDEMKKLKNDFLSADKLRRQTWEKAPPKPQTPGQQQ